MASNYEYFTTPIHHLRPDKLVVTTSIIKRWIGKTQEFTSCRKEKKQMPERRFHDFKISSSAQKKMTEKISWMYQLSKARYVKTSSGKEIFNFKLNFITLTLPSTQKHPTSVITSECFNQFLTECREKNALTNYVWRLEFQKNGNVHYHIVTDSFIDHATLLNYWNRILQKLDYVRPYTEKMQSFSLSDYVINCNYKGETPFDVLAKRYAKGKKEKWSNPPSVDVISCTSGKAIAFYISKYFAKKDKSGVDKNYLDNESNSQGLRLWFCSRGLSKLKSIQTFPEYTGIDMALLTSSIIDAKNYIFDYCQVIYFDIKKASNYVKSIIYQMFVKYAYDVGYRSA